MSALVTQPGNKVNQPGQKRVHTRSNFNLSHVLCQTDRFGDLTAHLFADTVPSDDWSVASISKVNSYTLKAPLMSHVRMSKDYFHVPISAILPLNWEKVVRIPNKGQDVPQDAGTSVLDFTRGLKSVMDFLFNQYYAALMASPLDPNACLATLLSLLTVGSYWYSKGSLLATAGFNIWPLFRSYNAGSQDWAACQDFDDVYDLCLTRLSQNVAAIIRIDGRNVYVADNGYYNGQGREVISWRRLMEIFSDAGGLSVSSIGTVHVDSAYAPWPQDLSPGLYTNIVDVLPAADAEGNNTDVCDLRRLWAYQLVCAHFFTNDRVDYIYSAELFRQLVGSYIAKTNTVFGAGQVAWEEYFSVDGVNYQYDYLSAYVFSWMISCIVQMVSWGDCPEVWAYMAFLFSWKKSLRYMDYFTGARTQPLAVGNVEVPLSSASTVNVIDIVEKNNFARLLNSINRGHQKIKDYLSGLFPGSRMGYDYHDPAFIGHTAEVVYGEVNENTGSPVYEDAGGFNTTQVNAVSRFKNTSQKYGFSFKVDIEGVLVGITSFDVPRSYSRTIARQMLARDRFDRFNPFLQFTQDQPIYRMEVDSADSQGSVPFGYQQPYMEYKQNFNRAVGGFVRNLPGFIFLADNFKELPRPDVIGPSYIRSSNVELDEFYLSLTGYSPASYFHFIVKNENLISARRPMAFNPQIL